MNYGNYGGGKPYHGGMRGVRPGSKFGGIDDKPVGSRKCVLCGHTYNRCDCTCTYCGAKKWTWASNHWNHHVCSGKSKSKASDQHAQAAAAD